MNILKRWAAWKPALSEPVVAYSITYPIGVLGMILAVYLTQRFWKVEYAAEARQLPEYSSSNEPIRSRTVCVTHASEQTIAEMIRHHHWSVVFGRIRRDGQMALVTGQTVLRPGDLVTLIGTDDALDEVTRAVGDTACNEHLEFDISQYDKRRIFVSSPQISGRRLRDLDIIGHYGALITRIRRGDVELLPHGETVLMPGDQVRVVAPHEQMDPLTRLFGDSYRAVSEVDILTFSLGLALGLLLGLVPIPLPGGVTLKLGIAGGPLIVALLAGALGRTGTAGLEHPLQRQPDPTADRPGFLSGRDGHTRGLCLYIHPDSRLRPGSVWRRGCDYLHHRPGGPVGRV